MENTKQVLQRVTESTESLRILYVVKVLDFQDKSEYF